MIGYLQAIKQIDHIGFCTLVEFLDYYEIQYDAKSLDKLKRAKFKLKTLEKLKDTHLLIPVFQISVLNLAQLTNCTLDFSNNEKGGLIKREPFICDGYTTNWFFISKKLLTDPIYQAKILPLRIILFTLLILDYAGVKKFEICKKKIELPEVACIERMNGKLTISSYTGSKTTAPEII
ncbi:MAG: hypothetical protein R3B60_03830 [Candidatus Paceibacterota bacterium]